MLPRPASGIQPGSPETFPGNVANKSDSACLGIPGCARTRCQLPFHIPGLWQYSRPTPCYVNQKRLCSYWQFYADVRRAPLDYGLPRIDGCHWVICHELRKARQSDAWRTPVSVASAYQSCGILYFSGSKLMISLCTTTLCSSYSASPHKDSISPKLSSIFSPCHTHSTGRQTPGPLPVG